MIRRLVPVIALAAMIVACGSPLQRAVNSLVEQARLDDPQVSATYNDNKDLLESAEAVPLWIDLLQNNDSPKVQRWAASILGNIGDESSLSALAGAVSSSNREVREAAVDSLRQFDPAMASGAFVQVLQTGNRDGQAAALGEMSRLQIQDPGAVAAIAAVAGSGDELMGTNALNTLADIGDDEAVAAIVAIAGDTSQSMRLRSHAIDMLGHVENATVADKVQELIGALRNEEGAEELLSKARGLS